MFVRCKRRFKDGKEHRYWSVVENVRVRGGRVVQRHVLYLGEINDSQRAAWCRSIEVVEGKSRSRQMALFPEDREAPALRCEVVKIDVAEVALHDPRQWGACWLALALWDRLDLDRFWGPRLPPSRQGTRWLDILKIQACYRLIDPGSEWRLHRHWYEHSALRDLLGGDRAIADDTLYRCLDKLLAHKQDFFSFLRNRWAALFDARFDVLLYDLTSTYFESDPPFEDKRRFGYLLEFLRCETLAVELGRPLEKGQFRGVESNGGVGSDCPQAIRPEFFFGIWTAEVQDRGPLVAGPVWPSVYPLVKGGLPFHGRPLFGSRGEGACVIGKQAQGARVSPQIGNAGFVRLVGDPGALRLGALAPLAPAYSCSPQVPVVDFPRQVPTPVEPCPQGLRERFVLHLDVRLVTAPLKVVICNGKPGHRGVRRSENHVIAVDPDLRMKTVQGKYWNTVLFQGSDRRGIAGTAEQVADHTQLAVLLVRNAGALERVVAPVGHGDIDIPVPGYERGDCLLNFRAGQQPHVHVPFVRNRGGAASTLPGMAPNLAYRRDLEV